MRQTNGLHTDILVTSEYFLVDTDRKLGEKPKKIRTVQGSFNGFPWERGGVGLSRASSVHGDPRPARPGGPSRGIPPHRVLRMFAVRVPAFSLPSVRTRHWQGVGALGLPLRSAVIRLLNRSVARPSSLRSTPCMSGMTGTPALRRVRSYCRSCPCPGVPAVSAAPCTNRCQDLATWSQDQHGSATPRYARQSCRHASALLPTSVLQF